MRKPSVAGLIVAGLVLTLGISPVWAQARDSDGTRMQARLVEVGSTLEDRLSPPEDQADWRMVRLEAGRVIELTLEVKSGEGTARLILTEATGNQLVSIVAGSSGVSIAREVGAGIYYIAVESSEALRYELSIR